MHIQHIRIAILDFCILSKDPSTNGNSNADLRSTGSREKEITNVRRREEKKDLTSITRISMEERCVDSQDSTSQYTIVTSQAVLKILECLVFGMLLLSYVLRNGQCSCNARSMKMNT
jgi:hypothetical protein